MNVAKPDIEKRMSLYEDGQIEFAILSLVKDPRMDLVSALASNVKAIQVLNARLESHDNNLSRHVDSQEIVGGEAILAGPDVAYGLTEGAVEQARLPSTLEPILRESVVSDILNYRRELYAAQAKLQASVRDEYETSRLNEAKVNARRHDFGPLALKLAQILARKSASEYDSCGSRKTKARRQVTGIAGSGKGSNTAL